VVKGKGIRTPNMNETAHAEAAWAVSRSSDGDAESALARYPDGLKGARFSRGGR